MKVLYCQKCDRYTTTATVDITTCITAKLQHDGTWVAWDADFGAPRDALHLVEDQEILCPDCDSLYVIVDVDECPHDWHTRWYDGNSRQCEICRVIQKGTVVWPTK